jgi:enoyl-CoA hydratase/carnithine racemase
VIHSDARGALVVLTIDRPERRNALDHEALDGLAASLAACGDDVRALVLSPA